MIPPIKLNAVIPEGNKPVIAFFEFGNNYRSHGYSVTVNFGPEEKHIASVVLHQKTANNVSRWDYDTPREYIPGWEKQDTTRFIWNGKWPNKLKQQIMESVTLLCEHMVKHQREADLQSMKYYDERISDITGQIKKLEDKRVYIVEQAKALSAKIWPGQLSKDSK